MRSKPSKKLLIVAGAVTGTAFLAKRHASSCGGFDFERMVARMPENAPPKWMFRNINTIRENTERILQLLEAEHTPGGVEPSLDPDRAVE
jgi:hypothetical protein